MLVIRLSRTGRRNLPHFRVVVAEKSAPIKGKFVEILGNFDPIQKVFKVAKDRVVYWFERGAKPTQKVARLLLKYENLKTVPIVERATRKPKKESKGGVKPSASGAGDQQGEAPSEGTSEATATEKVSAEVAKTEESGKSEEVKTDEAPEAKADQGAETEKPAESPTDEKEQAEG